MPTFLFFSTGVPKKKKRILPSLCEGGQDDRVVPRLADPAYQLTAPDNDGDVLRPPKAIF